MNLIPLHHRFPVLLCIGACLSCTQHYMAYQHRRLSLPEASLAMEISRLHLDSGVYSAVHWNRLCCAMRRGLRISAFAASWLLCTEESCKGEADVFRPPCFRYDTRTTTFSPDGRLFQVEYAMEAISNAGSALGVLAKDGVVLAAEKRITSKACLLVSCQRLLCTIDRPMLSTG